jgi:hypothetical protein
MAKCAGSKRDGSPCTATVETLQRYCWWHDPAHAAQRRRNASRAGKSKPNREIAAIKTLVEDLTNRVIGAEGTEPLPASAGAVAAQLINTRLRAIELERKIKETEELEERISALEGSKGGQRWAGA